MKNDDRGYLYYLRRAFNWKVRLGGLGFLPLNKLLLAGFAILGLGHPGFWLLGLAWEAGYLTFLPGSARFQNLVRGADRLSLRREEFDRQARLLEQLPAELRRRYDALATTCRSVLERAEGGPAGSAALQTGGLAQLLWMFLKLLHSGHNIERVLAQKPEAELEEELEGLRKRLAGETEGSPVARALKGTLDIQEKRLDNLRKGRGSLKVIQAELERIEKQASLMAEETSVSGDAQLVSVRLDSIVDSLQGTSRWMSEHDEYFRQLDDPAGAAGLLQPAARAAQKE